MNHDWVALGISAAAIGISLLSLWIGSKVNR
jgi:hypothetical protein